MKRLLTILAILTTMVISSCSKYDDSELRQKIGALEERVTSIEALLKASANKLTIVSIEETESGTIITFSDNSKVTINNATEGISPIVDVEVDGDLVYITLDDGTVLTFKKYEIKENYKIYYTTTDDKKLDWDSFDLNSFTNTYEDGQGVLMFDSPVNYVSYPSAETLKTLVIPESVVKIGSFYNCKNLKELYCKAITPPAISAPVYGANSKYYNFLDYYNMNFASPQYIGCIIYVPEQSVEAYKEAEGWRRYASYIKGYDFE